MSKASLKGAGARTRARELMVQALYQKQLAGHSTAELVAQFHEDTAYERIDQAFDLRAAVARAQGNAQTGGAARYGRRPDRGDQQAVGQQALARGKRACAVAQ